MNAKKTSMLLVVILLPMIVKAVDTNPFNSIFSNNGVSYKVYGWEYASDDVRAVYVEVVSKEGGYSGSVVIPDSIEYVRDYGYKTSKSKAPVRCIASRAFSNSPNLKTVSIPQTIDYICPDAFEGCVNLDNIFFDTKYNNYRWINNCLISGQTILFGNKNSVIANDVNSIGGGFYENIQGIGVPPGDIRYEGWYGAFKKCTDLESIVIPESVTRIGVGAFVGCTNIKEVTCYNTNPPLMVSNYYYLDPIEYPYIFDTTIENATLYVPGSAIEKYKASDAWNGFKEIVAIEGTEPLEKCATPTIDYKDGKLVFECGTDGAECVTTITSADVDIHFGNEVAISYTYNISTFAKAEGYANSEVVTAMLVWIEKDDTTTALNEEIEARAVLLQAYEGSIWIRNAEQGTLIEVYNVAGTKIASVTAQGTTQIATTLNAGEIAVVKIGNRTVKVVMR